MLDAGFASVRRLLLLMMSLSFAAAACGTGEASGVAEGADRAVSRNAIVMPLSLYVVSDADGGAASSLSSARTEEGLRELVERVGEIWSVAGVVFDPIEVNTVEVPSLILRDLALGDPQSFLAGAGPEFDVPRPGVVNGFYVAELFGVNGFAPAGTGAFFVVDRPTVHDERVSSHEIGHILGLHHDLDDPGRLMFRGTNGISLSDTEIDVARYGATGLLELSR